MLMGPYRFQFRIYNLFNQCSKLPHFQKKKLKLLSIYNTYSLLIQDIPLDMTIIMCQIDLEYISSNTFDNIRLSLGLHHIGPISVQQSDHNTFIFVAVILIDLQSRDIPRNSVQYRHRTGVNVKQIGPIVFSQRIKIREFGENHEIVNFDN